MNNYEEYGRLVIQAEIIQGKMVEIKRKIANELNKEKNVELHKAPGSKKD